MEFQFWPKLLRTLLAMISCVCSPAMRSNVLSNLGRHAMMGDKLDASECGQQNSEASGTASNGSKASGSWRDMAQFWYGKLSDQNPMGCLYHNISIVESSAFSSLALCARSLTCINRCHRARAALSWLFVGFMKHQLRSAQDHFGLL